MIEVFVLTAMLCRFDAAQPTDCQLLNSPVFHTTEESCVLELMERAVPWSQAQGLEITSFDCGPYTLPFNEGDPA